MTRNPLCPAAELDCCPAAEIHCNRNTVFDEKVQGNLPQYLILNSS